VPVFVDVPVVETVNVPRAVWLLVRVAVYGVVPNPVELPVPVPDAVPVPVAVVVIVVLLVRSWMLVPAKSCAVSESAPMFAGVASWAAVTLPAATWTILQLVAVTVLVAVMVMLPAWGRATPLMVTPVETRPAPSIVTVLVRVALVAVAVAVPVLSPTPPLAWMVWPELSGVVHTIVALAPVLAHTWPAAVAAAAGGVRV
jgi:hypothetical protein